MVTQPKKVVTLWTVARWISGEPAGQLYDLDDDPGERTNLYARRPEVVKRLTALLERYRKQGHSRPGRGD